LEKIRIKRKSSRKLSVLKHFCRGNILGQKMFVILKKFGFKKFGLLRNIRSTLDPNLCLIKFSYSQYFWVHKDFKSNKLGKNFVAKKFRFKKNWIKKIQVKAILLPNQIFGKKCLSPKLWSKNIRSKNFLGPKLVEQNFGSNKTLVPGKIWI